MSTDIVHWQDNMRTTQVKALWLYLELTLPITFGVMLIGIIFQFFKKRDERRSQKQHEAELQELVA